ncbi:MAG TPA: DUF4384 domain-containing protein [Candidatus Desulfofervidus auxilii]|uniref:DUF4384 domain-containing protein n=1 Tax=Desulfofervidus auxilii TaxID=1621989 RepID=A0A7V0NEN3_DESA2|nr:DUF4384 domain-containing protein [Candidatus Desulfofervidus auxilii]
MKKYSLVIVSLIVVLTFGLLAAYAQQATVEKQIKVEEKVEGLQEIKNPESGFKVELWTDREDATYKVGDEIVFYFKTNKDCRLTLLNVGTSGKTHIIFPNKYQKDDLVKAGKVYRVPAKDARWVFKAEGPAGIDLVKAIATLEKVALVDKEDLKPAGAVQEVKKPQSELAKDIAISLKPVNEKRWAEAEKIINVIE